MDLQISPQIMHYIPHALYLQHVLTVQVFVEIPYHSPRPPGAGL